MVSHLANIVAVAIAVTVISCGGHPPQPYEPSSDVVNCESACHNLHNLGCQSGANILRCEKLCVKVNQTGYMVAPMACMAHSRTRAEARLCGVNCPDSPPDTREVSQ